MPQSLATARKTLNSAFAELKQADLDPEKVRQAAEKGWRAAREAVYAVMRSHGEDVHGTIGSGRVGDFEASVLGRPRDKSDQPLTSGFSRAKDVLHGECFYDGNLPDDVKGELEMVGDLIEQASKDMVRDKSRGRKR